MTKVNVGRIGIWSRSLRYADPAEIPEAAAELEELGFGAIWVPGGIGGDVTGDLDRLLAATNRIPIATGIINLWRHDPAEIASWWKALPDGQQSRVLLGIGVSHEALIGDDYVKRSPLSVMRDYLDRLNAGGIPGESMCLAALGPKMLELSGERTAGAHPYLVTPEHSAEARAILGPGKLVAPEQGVILETDIARARALAKDALGIYLQMPNYANNWRRLGFSEDDIANVSDRLLDSLFASGNVERIKHRVETHLSSGANHVCMQVITDGDFAKERADWRVLAANLL